MVGGKLVNLESVAPPIEADDLSSVTIIYHNNGIIAIEIETDNLVHS